MINYNLKVDSMKNHPMDDKYGLIIKNSVYAGYPVTIVDNSEEIANGSYTHKPALCLLHLSERVRRYMSLKLFDEFLYIGFVFKTPTYRMYPYEYVTLTNEEIIKQLKQVLYFLQPTLHSRSLVGTSSKRLEDDPNYYEGYFVLNNEEEYTILKHRTTYKLYRGKKTYYPHWNIANDLLFKGELDFDIYTLSVEAERLRLYIVSCTNEILDDESNDAIARYRGLIKRIESKMTESDIHD
jgi:hypothetical protein